MKINSFAIAWIVVFGLITAALSVGFYSIERNLLLSTMADDLNRSLYRLEKDIQQLLEQGHQNEVQAILDQAPAINKTIANISISTDKKLIETSSSRALKGTVVGEEYLPLSQLDEGLIARNHVKFKSDFNYFEGAQKHDALLLVRVDEEYIFGRLNQVALYYGIAILLVVGLLTLVIFTVVQRLLVSPLEAITRHAKEANTKSEAYFIEEISELDNTLTHSFQSLREQQVDLKSALDESIYLDGILRTIADINGLLVSAKNIEELIAKGSARLAEHQGYSLCWIALENEGKLEVQAFSSDSSGKLSAGMFLASTTQEDPHNPVTQAFLLKKYIAVNHLENNSENEPWRLIAEHAGQGSFIALPLLHNMDQKSAGVLGLYAQSTEGFSLKETSMLEELAADIGFAIHAFRQRKQLEHHLTTDTITSLPNRVSLVDQLAINHNVTLAIINIDRFSDINDVYGITIGDGLLARYGQWLTEFIKPNGGISLYKLGSDEYGLLFTQENDIDRSKEFMEQLIAQSAKAAFLVKEIEVVITVTAGLAGASERILQHATAALKQAKTARQSLHIYASAPSRKDQQNNIEWYKRIKAAIEESRIVPFFQPIVDNQTRRIIKYEALARLIEKDGSVIAPYAFLGIAKKTRLYGQLTKMMIEKTGEIFKNSDIPVSINLSTEDLLNAELADAIEKMIATNKMGKTIIFEILESEGIDNYAEVSVFVDRFKSMGCRFAIDDFGSGYSNFDHLLKLNVDTIKIDGSLIKNLPHDRNARIFVQHIRDFAHEMGITTVAEFVANEEIYIKVKEMGIDASQGYYFYEPSSNLVANEERAT